MTTTTGRSNALTTIERYRRLPTEEAMREAITEAVALRGGRLWYVRDSRDSPETEDMPDLIIVVPGFAALVELKSYRRNLTHGQMGVADLLATVTTFWCGVVRSVPREGECAYDEFLAMIEDYAARSDSLDVGGGIGRREHDDQVGA